MVFKNEQCGRRFVIYKFSIWCGYPENLDSEVVTKIIEDYYKKIDSDRYKIKSNTLPQPMKSGKFYHTLLYGFDVKDSLHFVYTEKGNPLYYQCIFRYNILVITILPIS